MPVYAEKLRDAFPHEGEGWWVRGDAPDWSAGPDAVAAAIERQVASRFHLDVRALPRLLVGGLAALAYPSEKTPLMTEWLFLRRTEGGEPSFGHNVFDDPRDFASRAPFAEQLRAKKIAIVGCGALGWPIAVSLARAGVRSFLLVDGDDVWPGNLARLDAGLGQVGEPKVEALAADLRQVAAGVKVAGVQGFLGSEVGLGMLADAAPDLIVDATAEERSAAVTNAAAVLLRAPALYAWMTYTVRAARIFRVVPGRTPCYACVARARPRSIADSPARRTRGVWSGANFAIDAVAAAAARMAVCTLVGEAASAANPDQVVLRFGGPVPRATRVELRRDPRCEVCGR